MRWYRLAAEQGDADAQSNLGVMYDSGHGVPQDYAEAVRWYRRAAEQGDASAQFDLGRMYGFALGKGISDGISPPQQCGFDAPLNRGTYPLKAQFLGLKYDQMAMAFPRTTSRRLDVVSTRR